MIELTIGSRSISQVRMRLHTRGTSAVFAETEEGSVRDETGLGQLECSRENKDMNPLNKGVQIQTHLMPKINAVQEANSITGSDLSEEASIEITSVFAKVTSDDSSDEAAKSSVFPKFPPLDSEKDWTAEITVRHLHRFGHPPNDEVSPDNY